MPACNYFCCYNIYYYLDSCKTMALDYYKVDVLHFINPHLIWVLVKKEDDEDTIFFEQIGVYGILPQNVTFGGEDCKLRAEPCEQWMPAACVTMKRCFLEAVEVWFSPTYIDEKSSIFDENTHKYGDLKIIKKNGNKVSVLQEIINSDFAYEDESLFHQQLRGNNLTTQLNYVTVHDVMKNLEEAYKTKNIPKEKWLSAFKKQTRVYEDGKHMESSITRRKLKVCDRDNMDTLLENKLNVLKLCKDVDEVSMGRACTTRTSLNSGRSIITSLALKKKLEWLESQSKVNRPEEMSKAELNNSEKQYNMHAEKEIEATHSNMKENNDFEDEENNNMVSPKKKNGFTGYAENENIKKGKKTCLAVDKNTNFIAYGPHGLQPKMFSIKPWTAKQDKEELVTSVIEDERKTEPEQEFEVKKSQDVYANADSEDLLSEGGSRERMETLECSSTSTTRATSSQFDSASEEEENCTKEFRGTHVTLEGDRGLSSTEEHASAPKIPTNTRGKGQGKGKSRRLIAQDGREPAERLVADARQRGRAVISEYSEHESSSGEPNSGGGSSEDRRLQAEVEATIRGLALKRLKSSKERARAMSQASASIMAAVVEQLRPTTATDEQSKLQMEVARLTAAISDLRMENNALKADLTKLQETEPQEVSCGECQSTPDNQILNIVQQELAAFQRRFDVLESRILHPPLAASQTPTCVAAVANSPSQSGQISRRSGPMPASLALSKSTNPPTKVTAGTSSGAVTQPVGAPAGEVSRSPAPMPPSESPVTNAKWQVEGQAGTSRKGNRKAARAARQRAKRLAGRQRRKERRVAAKNATVEITLKADAVEEGVNYPDVFGKAKEAEDLQELAANEELRLSATATEVPILEIPGAASDPTSDALAESNAEEPQRFKPTKWVDNSYSPDRQIPKPRGSQMALTQLDQELLLEAAIVRAWLADANQAGDPDRPDNNNINVVAVSQARPGRARCHNYWWSQEIASLRQACVVARRRYTRHRRLRIRPIDAEAREAELYKEYQAAKTALNMEIRRAKDLAQ